MEHYTINHPWFIYPKEPFSSYKNYNVYRNELTRLMEFIKMDCSPNTVFFLIIGAAMEELLLFNKEDQNNIDLEYQWRQLFPYWIEKYIEENPLNPVRILIVSPNREFAEDYTPLFVKFTEEYNWKKHKNNRVVSSRYDIEVNIFCTPFPHIDINANKKLTLYKRFLDEKMFNEIIITDNDIKFVNLFYHNLENLFNSIIKSNGVVICNSYAVFNVYSDLINVKNYKMFFQIKRIFSRLSRDKSLLTEWVFRQNCYCTYNINKTISYVKPNVLRADGDILILVNIGDEVTINYDLAKNYIVKN